MTDTSKFRADVLKLFEPRPPLRHIDPIDVAPSRRKTAYITGIGSYLNDLKGYSEEKYEETKHEETLQMKEQRAKREKQIHSKQKLDEDFAKWNPQEDPLIKGDPYRTVFVGRLDYNVTEIDLQKEFTKFGAIERVRIVRDKASGSSKGYAFVVFEHEMGARAAYKEGNGMKIGSRNVLTDVERGRTSKSWVPRRLGGGVGGRHYSQKRPIEKLESKKKIETSAPVPPSSSRMRGNGRFPGPGVRDSGSHRSRYDPRDSRDRHSTLSRGYSNYDSGMRYKSRSERPDRSERRDDDRNDHRGYNSRLGRDHRDLNDRERDRDRDSRIASEKDRERLRY